MHSYRYSADARRSRRPVPSLVPVSEPLEGRWLLAADPALFTFGPPQAFPVIPNVWYDGIVNDVVTADFNNDGKADVAAANGGISIFLGDGAGSLGPATNLPTGFPTGWGTSGAVALAVGDFNNDGNVDLAAVAGNGVDMGPGSIRLFLGNGNGTFRAPAAGYSTLGHQNSARATLLAADFNNDQKLDLAVANPMKSGPNSNSNSISILLGNGSGGFAPPVEYPYPEFSGTTTWRMAAADFNGDGKTDLAVGPAEIVGGARTHLRLGNGDGTFGNVIRPAGTTPDYLDNFLGAGDFNEDGKPDLYTARNLLLNAGGGTFTVSPVRYAYADGTPFTVYAYDGVVADFNNDGHLDVATADTDRGNVLYGRGDGTFVPVVGISLGPPDGLLPVLYGLAAADFNGDGRLDLVATNTNPDPAVSVVLSRPAASVVGRYAFYNHSALDGGDALANAQDDAAIATDKVAFLSGQSPTFANVTSYNRGLNGVMIDVTNLPQDATLTADDFVFSSGTAPLSVTVRRGAGVGGSDRVTLTWPDYNPASGPAAAQAAANGWLTVIVKVNANTGLATPDVFSFGNLIGETGDGTGSSGWKVSALDLASVKRALNTDASLTSTSDFDRNGRTNALDLAVVRRALNQALPLPAPAPSAQVIALAPGLFSDSSTTTRRLADEVLA